MGTSEKTKVLDDFSQVMVNSGHDLEVVRKSLMNGIKGHERKVHRCIKEGKDFHRCASASAKSRKSKKLTQKMSWFKNKTNMDTNSEEKEKKSVDEKNSGKSFGGLNVKSFAGTVANPTEESKEATVKTKQQPSTVLFVEHTKGGSLQKTVRAVVDRLQPLLGFSVRVTERGGTPLGSILSSKNVGGRSICEREDCKICPQPGEVLENCKRRNVLYESECQDCNGPEDWKTRDQKSLQDNREQPSIYVGETNRSLFERTKEHWGDCYAQKESSHMHEHHSAAHGGEGEANFRFRLVKTFKSSLDRQIAEAIRIYKRGNILNRKGEYNRCSLTRLVIDNKWEEDRWDTAWGEGEENKDEFLDLEEGLREKKKNKKGSQGNEAASKRLKVENSHGEVWGEQVGEGAKQVMQFLQSGGEGGNRAKKQGALTVLTGISWLAYEAVKETVLRAAELAMHMEDMLKWKDWDKAALDVECREGSQVLWHELDEIDNKEYKYEKEIEIKTKEASKRPGVKNEAGVKKRGKAIKTKKDPKQKTMDSFLIKKVPTVARRVDTGNYVEVHENLKCEEELEKECRFHRISTLKLKYVRKEVVEENNQSKVFRNLDLSKCFLKHQNYYEKGGVENENILEQTAVTISNYEVTQTENSKCSGSPGGSDPH